MSDRDFSRLSDTEQISVIQQTLGVDPKDAAVVWAAVADPAEFIGQLNPPADLDVEAAPDEPADRDAPTESVDAVDATERQVRNGATQRMSEAADLVAARGRASALLDEYSTRNLNNMATDALTNRASAGSQAELQNAISNGSTPTARTELGQQSSGLARLLIVLGFDIQPGPGVVPENVGDVTGIDTNSDDAYQAIQTLFNNDHDFTIDFYRTMERALDLGDATPAGALSQSTLNTLQPDQRQELAQRAQNMVEKLERDRALPSSLRGADQELIDGLTEIFNTTRPITDWAKLIRKFQAGTPAPDLGLTSDIVTQLTPNQREDLANIAQIRANAEQADPPGEQAEIDDDIFQPDTDDDDDQQELRDFDALEADDDTEGRGRGPPRRADRPDFARLDDLDRRFPQPNLRQEYKRLEEQRIQVSRTIGGEIDPAAFWDDVPNDTADLILSRAEFIAGRQDPSATGVGY
jgi:hypothetical protein